VNEEATEEVVMNSKKTVDARGLSCPLPQMLAKRAINQAKEGTIEVLVDNATARDNIRRLAEASGWNVTIEELTEHQVRMVLSK